MSSYFRIFSHISEAPRNLRAFNLYFISEIRLKTKQSFPLIFYPYLLSLICFKKIFFSFQKIVVVDVTAEEKKEIKPNMELSFTYEVIWKQSNTLFDKRFERYLDPSFFQHRVFLIKILIKGFLCLLK